LTALQMPEEIIITNVPREVAKRHYKNNSDQQADSISGQTIFHD
jgi:hypothetical protein